MKKSSNVALKTTTSVPAASKPAKDMPGAIHNHDHIHASNCGHKSFVHGDHIDYEQNGKFHYMLNGKTYECSGPNAKVIAFPKTKK